MIKHHQNNKSSFSLKQVWWLQIQRVSLQGSIGFCLDASSKGILHLTILLPPHLEQFRALSNWSQNTCRNYTIISYNVVILSKLCRVENELLVVYRIKRVSLLTSKKHLQLRRWLLTTQGASRGLPGFALSQKSVFANSTKEIPDSSFPKHLS